MAEPKVPWPHAPLHQSSERGAYFVTTSTYRKQHHFRGAERVRVPHRGLLTVAEQFGWQLEAWAVFSNHYHFVGHSSEDAAGHIGLDCPDRKPKTGVLPLVREAGWRG